MKTYSLVILTILFFLSHGHCWAQCEQKRLEVSNTSKLHLAIDLNGKPLVVLKPGQSLDDQGVLIPGINTIKVRVLAPKSGQENPKFKTVKKRLSVDCNSEGSESLDLSQKTFKKKKKIKKKKKKVGNKKGRSFDLSGTWRCDVGGEKTGFPVEATLEIIDAGEFLVFATLAAGESETEYNGFRLGSRLVLAGPRVDDSVAVSLELGVTIKKDKESLNGRFFLGDDSKGPMSCTKITEEELSITGVWTCFIESGSSLIFSMCKKPDGSLVAKRSIRRYIGEESPENVFNFTTSFETAGGDARIETLKNLTLGTDSNGNQILTGGSQDLIDGDTEQTISSLPFTRCNKSTLSSCNADF